MSTDIFNTASFYTVPQVRVYQDSAAEPTSTDQIMQTVIIGPHYDLKRYGNEDEKSLTYAGAYTAGTAMVSPWPNRAPGGSADADSAVVNVDNAYLKYYNSGTALINLVTGTRNQIRSDTINWQDYGTDKRSPLLPKRDVLIGDGVSLSVPAAGIDGMETQVVGFVHDKVPSSIDAAEIATGNRQASTAMATATYKGAGDIATIPVITPDAAAYNPTDLGLINDIYTVVVIESTGTANSIAAKVQVLSKSGLDNVEEVVLTGATSATFNIGTKGLSGTIALQTVDGIVYNLQPGQAWEVDAKAAFIPPSVTSSGTYVGPEGLDTIYVVRVTRSGVIGSSIAPQVTVQTNDGVDSGGPYDVGAADIEIGNFGVKVAFTGTTMAEGDQYTIGVTAAKDGPVRTLVLANSLPVSVDPSMSIQITLMAVQDIKLNPNRLGEPPYKNYTADAQGVTLNSMVTYYDNTIVDQANNPMRLQLMKGDVYVSYRALLPTNTYVTGEIRGAALTSIEDVLGPISPDNPLCLGTYLALLNSGASIEGYTVENVVPVGYLAVPSDDVKGYASALAKLTTRYGTYIPVALSQDPEVQQLVATHIRTMSIPENGRWRISYFNSALSELSGLVTTNEDGEAILADIYAAPEDNERNLTVYWDNGKFMTNGVRPGDILRADYHTDGFGDWTYGEYVVDRVLSEDMIKLMEGPEVATAVSSKVEVWRNLSSNEMAKAYAQRSVEIGKMLGSGNTNTKRGRHVFPPEVTIGADVVPGVFAAAAIAGLRAGVAPQQPLTNVEVLGIDALPWSTQVMSSDDLDLMAQYGTWILTQDLSDGTVYTRHQLTTSGYSSATKYREDSMVVNLDNICYKIQAVMKAWIGRANITEQFIAKLEAQIVLVVSEMQVSSNDNLGPQITEFELLRLERHAVQRDKVVCYARILGPDPFNYLDIHIVA